MSDMTSPNVEGITSGPRRTAQELPWWACGGLRLDCAGCGRRGGAFGEIFMRPVEGRRLAAALAVHEDYVKRLSREWEKEVR